MNRFALATATLVVALGLSGGLTAAERSWQTGTWTDAGTKRQLIDFGPGSSGFGPPGRNPSMRAMADVRTYVIETDNLRLELQDTVPVGRRSVDVEIGAPVTFAIDKKAVYVRDPDGKEHKLRITKQTAKDRDPKGSRHN
jgi:hypothetical protein